MNTYHSGDIISATITNIMRFGMFARLPEGIEGLIHVSSIPDLQENQDLETAYKSGQEIKVKILHIDIDRRRLGLSLVEEA
jgi:small subunit ribosomal protein S1